MSEYRKDEVGVWKKQNELELHRHCWNWNRFWADWMVGAVAALFLCGIYAIIRDWTTQEDVTLLRHEISASAGFLQQQQEVLTRWHQELNEQALLLEKTHPNLILALKLQEELRTVKKRLRDMEQKMASQSIPSR